MALFDARRPRSRSLDVFRGATVALMILVNNPGSWQHLYAPLAHAAWHGWTLTDLVFPFFLFAVGNALALTSAHVAGATQAPFWPRWLRRTWLILALGLLLNAAPFLRWTDGGDLVLRSWDNLRLMGVLQRIALAWSCAALIVHLGGVRAAWLASVLLLLGYWAACVAWGRPGDPYSLEGFFGTALDRQLLGVAHLYRGEGVPFDPEGLASTPPAIAQVLLGYLAGQALAGLATPAPQALPYTWPKQRWRVLPAGGSALQLALMACVALLLAWWWQPLMPINKKLWTSSYVLLTSGLALTALLLIVWAVERRGWRGPLVRLFEAYGQNALFIFVLSGLVPRFWGLLKGLPAAAGLSPVAPAAPDASALAGSLLADPRAASLLVALLHVAGYGMLAWWLARRRIFIRV